MGWVTLLLRDPKQVDGGGGPGAHPSCTDAPWIGHQSITSHIRSHNLEAPLVPDEHVLGTDGPQNQAPCQCASYLFIFCQKQENRTVSGGNTSSYINNGPLRVKGQTTGHFCPNT